MSEDFKESWDGEISTQLVLIANPQMGSEGIFRDVDKEDNTIREL